MVTQKNTNSTRKTNMIHFRNNKASNFVGTTPREFEDLSTLFSWVVFKNTAIEAETKRSRMANETSAIETPHAPREATDVPSYPSTNPNQTQSID